MRWFLIRISDKGIQDLVFTSNLKVNRKVDTEKEYDAQEYMENRLKLLSEYKI